MVHAFYASAEEQYGIKPKLIEYDNFELDKDGNLILIAEKKTTPIKLRF